MNLTGFALRIGYMQELVQPNASSNDRAYGYQVWLNRGEVKKYWPDLPEDAYGFTGNRGQAVMIFPSSRRSWCVWAGRSGLPS